MKKKDLKKCFTPENRPKVRGLNTHQLKQPWLVGLHFRRNTILKASPLRTFKWAAALHQDKHQNVRRNTKKTIDGKSEKDQHVL